MRVLSPSDIALWCPPVRVDLLRSADGIETESAIARAELATIDALIIPVLTMLDATPAIARAGAAAA